MATYAANAGKVCSAFARLPGNTEHVCWRTERMRMDGNTAEIAVKALKEIRQRLEQAAAIAKAAEACAEARNIEKGIGTVLDVGPLIHEVNTYLNAASLMNAIPKT